MSYFYVEFWKATEAWKALPKAEKEAYIEYIKPLIRGIAEQPAVKLLGMMKNEGSYPGQTDYTYAAIWEMPSEDMCRHMEDIVENIDWKKYFDQINFRSQKTPAESILRSYLQDDVQ